VQESWNSPTQSRNSTSKIAAKFKNLRRTLKQWSRGISKISNLIARCNEVISTLDKIEEQRALFVQEANFRLIIKNHINRLLKYKNDYWRQRYTIRLVQFGDKPTKFFHVAATKRYMLNTIKSIKDEEGRDLSEMRKKLQFYGTHIEEEWVNHPTPKPCFKFRT
jgi:hypothetical protein